MCMFRSLLNVTRGIFLEVKNVVWIENCSPNGRMTQIVKSKVLHWWVPKCKLFYFCLAEVL